jgi:kynureninase
MADVNRTWCAAQDAADVLAPLRACFTLPESVIYLDGNSLGAMPAATPALAAQTISRDWGVGLVKSWNTAGWFDLPTRLGDRIAPLIGAEPGEVVVCDSTSVNLFKLLSAAIALRPERATILMEAGDFPTNGYIAQGLGGRATIRFVARDEIADTISTDTIALCLSHAHYKSGELHDMAALTLQAHAAGALAIWDVCHSAGALPVALNECGVDFAVGCTYKYLNGGPGAPGFVFAASRHLADAAQPVQGWWGHEDPFAFTPDFQPKPGIRRFLTGTPPIVSMAMIEAGIAVHEQADMDTIRAKSLALGDLLIALVEERLDGFTLASPRDGAQRGSQVSFAHPHGYAIMQALIAAGVIGDFRAPDLLRFGFAPLYVRYVDVWDAVECLADIMESGIWQEARFSNRASVT